MISVIKHRSRYTGYIYLNPILSIENTIHLAVHPCLFGFKTTGMSPMTDTDINEYKQKVDPKKANKLDQLNERKYFVHKKEYLENLFVSLVY